MSTMPTTLGLIEAFDRHGALLARAPITRWPVTVGRALDCDLVLDDPFVAPRHLRIDRAVNEPRTVQIEVLETRNGARLQRKQHGPGEHFDWPDGAPIDLGHTHITLRLADAQIADEQPLPQFPWRTVGTTAALVALVLLVGLGESWLDTRGTSQYLKAVPGVLLTLLVGLGESWLDTRDTSQYLKAVPGVLLTLLVVLGAWSGVWAAANKVFAGH